MKEREIEPNADGVLLVTCPCGAKLARHMNQTPPVAGEFYEVLCVSCRKHRHFFSAGEGKVLHTSRPSRPINMGGGLEA